MARKTLTDARIGALVPRKSAYDIRDGKLGGFGVRVTPSGRKRFFVHCQHRGERVWKIVGEVGAMDIAEARSLAETMLAAIRRGEPAPARPEEARFEAVAETVFRQHERVWKPRTLDVNRGYLKNQILPHFADRNIADIDSRDVRNWFAASAATPVAADRSMPILSVIMREAERMGLRLEGSNPCRGTRRYGAVGLGYIVPGTYLPAMAREIVPSPWIFGWGWPVFGAAAFLSTLASAALYRRFSNRRIWGVSQVAMAAGVLLPAIFPHILSIVAAGLCVGGTFMVITMAGLREAHRIATPGDAVRHVAAMTAAFAAGQTIAPIFAGAL